MKLSRWKFVGCLLVVFLAVGCRTQEPMAEPTPEATQASETTLTPEATPALFVPIKDDAVQEKKEVLQENLEKKDASTQAAYNAVNQMFTQDETSKVSLFCIDAETGAVYFVNQNKDFYIYRIKDGETELAVSMPAKELYAYGGTLYFMIESYGKYQMEDIKDGDIYCYTPEDGTIELVYAVGVMAEEENMDGYKLWIDENGIYFSYHKMETIVTDGEERIMENIKSYCLPFGAESPIEDKLLRTKVPRWKDYAIATFRTPEQSASSYPELIMRRAMEDSVEYKELSIGRPRKYCIMEDKLYYVPNISKDIKIGVVDLQTGEQEDYSIWEELKKLYYYPDGAETSPEDFMLSDKEMTDLIEEWFQNAILINAFTATEKYFWVVHRGSNLIRIDRKTKETICFVINGRIDSLYTDGMQIYGMYAPTERGTAHMAQILTDEVLSNELLGTKYLAVEYLTD